MKYSNKYSRKKVSNLTWNSYCYVTILDCLYFFHRITCSRCVTPTKTDWASWTWTGKTLLPSCLINLVCSPPSVTPRMFHTLMTSEILLHLRHCAHPPWHYMYTAAKERMYVKGRNLTFSANLWGMYKKKTPSFLVLLSRFSSVLFFSMTVIFSKYSNMKIGVSLNWVSNFSKCRRTHFQQLMKCNSNLLW